MEDGSNFFAAERLGNVNREMASVLSELMNSQMILDESNMSDVGFRFVCVLTENLHHKVEGFSISIVVNYVNSDLWTEKLIKILKLKNLSSAKVVRSY